MIVSPTTRVAVITGASSGLGAEMARQLAARRVAVGLIARRERELSELGESIRERGGRCVSVSADVADRDATIRAVRRIESELGTVDLMLANAGMSSPIEARDFSSRDLARLLEVNVLGVAHAFEAVLPGMLARGGGQLVGVSSLAGFRGLPIAAGYCASKAALSTLLEGLRIELRGSGVTVTTVHPGYVRTPMTAGQGGPQPFLMELEPAATRILRGIAARRRAVDFPLAASLSMRVIRLIPGPLYEALASRYASRKRTR